MSRTTGWLSTRDVVSLLLPLVAFCTALAWLVSRALGRAAVRSWWAKLDGLEKGLLAMAAAVALLACVLLVQHALTPLTRFFGGSWGTTRVACLAATYGRCRQNRRWDRIEELIRDGDEILAAQAYRSRHQRFPLKRSDVMPTALGNVFGAAESYPADPHRYGMDAALFWPRLYPLLPEPLRTELVAARAMIDMALVSGSLAGVLAGVVALFGGFAHVPWGPRLLLAVALAVVARVMYRWAVVSAARYGELVRSAFDISRRSLLVALGVQLPTTLDAEQLIWQALAQLLYRGGVSSDLEGVLRFTGEPP